jgi:chromosome segregation ATPase
MALRFSSIYQTCVVVNPPLSPQTEPSSESDLEIDREIAEVEELLSQVKQRYEQIRIAQADLTPLTQQQRELQKQLKSSQVNSLAQAQWRDRQGLKEELAAVEQRLTEISVELESRLISWQSFREPFWQILRFGGVGIILGYYLKALAG